MTTAAEIRADARARLLGAVLDAAYAQTVAAGWGSVRMGAVAADVGISRQGLHGAFGTKQALGEALVMREADAFLAAVLAEFDAAPQDPATAMEATVTTALERLRNHPLLRSILDAPSGEVLLPMLTSRGGPLLQRVHTALAARVAEQRPDADPAAVSCAVDAVVRLVLSHAIMPAGPAQDAGRRIAALFEAALA